LLFSLPQLYNVMNVSLSIYLYRKYHNESVGRTLYEIDVRYRHLKPVGSGSYGIVCSATDTVTGQKVAIKKISNVFEDLIDAKRILREIKLLRHLGDHENVIHILDIMTMPPVSMIHSLPIQRLLEHSYIRFFSITEYP
jgi:serine/threonine protein kinase